MKLVIDEERCKGCNLCMMVCPYRIFQEGTKPNEKGTASSCGSYYLKNQCPCSNKSQPG